MNDYAMPFVGASDALRFERVLSRDDLDHLMRPGDVGGGLLLARPAWHARAACRGVGADQFFVEKFGDLRLARALCSACPVRDECAAQGDEEEAGMWGGLTAGERRKARTDARRARRARAAPAA